MKHHIFHQPFSSSSFLRLLSPLSSLFSHWSFFSLALFPFNHSLLTLKLDTVRNEILLYGTFFSLISMCSGIAAAVGGIFGELINFCESFNLCCFLSQFFTLFDMSCESLFSQWVSKSGAIPVPSVREKLSSSEESEIRRKDAVQSQPAVSCWGWICRSFPSWPLSLWLSICLSFSYPPPFFLPHSGMNLNSEIQDRHDWFVGVIAVTCGILSAVCLFIFFMLSRKGAFNV